MTSNKDWMHLVDVDGFEVKCWAGECRSVHYAT